MFLRRKPVEESVDDDDFDDSFDEDIEEYGDVPDYLTARLPKCFDPSITDERLRKAQSNSVQE